MDRLDSLSYCTLEVCMLVEVQDKLISGKNIIMKKGENNDKSREMFSEVKKTTKMNECLPLSGRGMWKAGFPVMQFLNT